jgi:pilus assembly protein CpaE
MDKNIKFLAVMRSAEKAEELRTAVDGVNDIEFDVRVDSLREVAPTMVNGHAPDVLLVDLALDEPEEFDHLSGMMRDSKSDMAVLATADQANFDSIRRLMRMGVSDFIPQPMKSIDVRSALEAATSKLTPRRDATDGAVLTFLRSCGGAGATTLAVQSALELAGRRRSERKSVCLIDFDLQLGNVALSLDLESEVGLGQILENPARLDSEFFKGSLARHSSGIDVLAAPDSIIPLEALTPELAERIIRLARQNFDYVVVDMPQTWTQWTGYVAGASDLVVLVTEISVPSVQRCRRLFDILRQQELDELPLFVVANQFRGGFGASRRKSEAEKALGRRIDCFIRADAETAHAARDRGVPISEVRGRSPIVRDLRKLIESAKSTVRVERGMAAVPSSS